MDKETTSQHHSGSDDAGEMLLSSDGESSHDAELMKGMWNEKARWHPNRLLPVRLLPMIIICLLAAVVIVQSIILWAPTNTVSKTASIAPTPAESSGPSTSSDCGTSAAEAEEAGCVFDYMNFSWQPKDCYYPSLDIKHTAAMRSSLGAIQWWADANLTQPLPDDADVLKMFKEVWVDRRFHYKHCMYGWNLLHYSYDTGNPLPDLMTYNHSLHCAKELNKGIEQDDGTELKIEHAVTWYSGCVWPRA